MQACKGEMFGMRFACPWDLGTKWTFTVLGTKITCVTILKTQMTLWYSFTDICDNFKDSKVYWLKDGDINPSFFHSFATTRMKNIIASLTRDDDMVVTEHRDICNVANSCFNNMYCGATIEIDEVWW